MPIIRSWTCLLNTDRSSPHCLESTLQKLGNAIPSPCDARLSDHAIYKTTRGVTPRGLVQMIRKVQPVGTAFRDVSKSISEAFLRSCERTWLCEDQSPLTNPIGIFVTRPMQCLTERQIWSTDDVISRTMYVPSSVARCAAQRALCRRWKVKAPKLATSVHLGKELNLDKVPKDFIA